MSQLYWWPKHPFKLWIMGQDNAPPRRSSVKLVTVKSTPHVVRTSAVVEATQAALGERVAAGLVR